MQHNLYPKRSIKKIIILLLLFFTNTERSYSANDYDLPIKSTGSIEFYLDVCQYETLPGATRIEFTYSVDLSQPPIGGRTDSLNPVATFRINFQLFGSLNEILLSTDETKRVLLTGNSETIFLDLKKIETRDDSLSLLLSISDSLSGKKGVVKKSLVRRQFTTELSISDLYFVSHIQKSTKPGVFEKSGLLMLPNVMRNFSHSEPTPKAYVYFEINHLAIRADKPSGYSVSYVIEDLSGKEVAAHQRPTILKTSSNCSRVEIIPLAELKTGLYKLTLSVTDLLSGESVSNWRYFSVSGSENAQELLLAMTENDVKKYFDQIKYIATAEEKELFKKLTSRGKQEFLINFWKLKDPSPETSENEFMQEHFRRLAYAGASFAGGIDSDMGRIQIQYGTPVEIKRQFSTTEFNKPVQIWYYAIQGSTEFVFVDRSGDGKYVLVHSTHPDEYQNFDWIKDIR